MEHYPMTHRFFALVAGETLSALYLAPQGYMIQNHWESFLCD